MALDVVVGGRPEQTGEFLGRMVEVERRVVADVDVRGQLERGMAGRDHALAVDCGDVAVDQQPMRGPRARRRPDRGPDVDDQRRRVVRGRGRPRRRQRRAETVPAAVLEHGQVDHRRVVLQLPQTQPDPEDGPSGQQQRHADAERHGLVIADRPVGNDERAKAELERAAGRDQLPLGEAHDAGRGDARRRRRSGRRARTAGCSRCRPGRESPGSCSPAPARASALIRTV